MSGTQAERPGFSHRDHVCQFGRRRTGSRHQLVCVQVDTLERVNTGGRDVR